jgi:hypothetical protein
VLKHRVKLYRAPPRARAPMGLLAQFCARSFICFRSGASTQSARLGAPVSK